jgi:Tol biopolymer transport system component
VVGEGMMKRIFIFITLTLILCGQEETWAWGVKRSNETLEGKVVIATEVRKGDEFVPSIYIWEIKENKYYKLISFPPPDSTSNNNINYPRWSPDGRKIVFVYTGSFYKPHKDRENSIFIVNADGTELKKIYTTVGRHISSPSFSPDGKEIIFIRDNEICNINIHSGEFKQLTNNYKTKNKEGNILYFYKTYLCLSPDGERIAFGGTLIDVTKDKRLENGIYIINKDNLKINLIRGELLFPESIKWSPDGSKIAFCNTHRTYYGIYIIDSNGKNERRIKKRRCFREICWSSDGKKIMYSSVYWAEFSFRPPRTDLRIINIDGTNDRLIKRIIGDPGATFDWWTPIKKE